VCLRVTGKRTLSKWNAFDFVVTIALGSTLASAFLSKSVALTEGILPVAVLVGLQFIITWLSVRFSSIRHLVKGEPTLLLDHGIVPAECFALPARHGVGSSRGGSRGRNRRARRRECGGTGDGWQLQCDEELAVGFAICSRSKAQALGGLTDGSSHSVAPKTKYREFRMQAHFSD
jgi:hypothetical protein